MLHPLALISLVVLVLNDHLLKPLTPGWLTGKLSDVAGLLFFPFLLLALVDVIMRRRREPGSGAAACAAPVRRHVPAGTRSGPIHQLTRAGPRGPRGARRRHHNDNENLTTPTGPVVA